MFLEAWGYYLRCMVRNRVLVTARRLRNPKYVIGLALVVLYFCFIFFGNPSLSRGSDPERHRRNATLFLSAMGLVQVMVAWFASGRGVAFREAEVQILFPRPFSRFQLLMFKWLVTLFTSLISSLIFGLFVTRYGGFSYPNIVLGFWLLGVLLTTHSTLFSLWRSTLESRGGYWARLRLLPGWFLLGAIVLCAGLAWQSIGSVQSWADAKTLAVTRPLSYLLAPFELLVAPVVTLNLSAFLIAALVPIGVILAHLLIMWRADMSFEDRALEVAAKIQKVRREGLGAFRAKKDLVISKPGSPWSLAPKGPAWQALVWKNVISIARFSRRTMIRVAVLVVILTVVVGQRVSDTESGGDGATRFGFVLLGLLMYLTVLGPMLVRVDLRIDIPHFDVLKSMPLRGRSVIFGEILGPVLVLGVIQLVVCIIAAILITEESGRVFGWAEKLPALIATLCAFLALDFALLTSANLLALWMPGFVRLGRGVKVGMDQLGQNLLGLLVTMLAILILFLPAGLLGTGVGFAARWLEFADFTSVSAGVVFGSAVVFLETYAFIWLSEGRYNRFDITSEGAMVDV